MNADQGLHGLRNLFLKQKVPHSYSSADESALSSTEFGMTRFWWSAIDRGEGGLVAGLKPAPPRGGWGFKGKQNLTADERG